MLARLLRHRHRRSASISILSDDAAAESDTRVWRRSDKRRRSATASALWLM